MNQDYRVVDREIKRIITNDIVTGKAVFTDDLRVTGMAYGKASRSPYPYARITRIDVGRARACDGVRAVVTYKDILGNIYITSQVTPAPHYRLLNETVRFVGDPVALVVADAEDIALDIMELIEVEYKELPPVFTINEVLVPDAPQLCDVFPGNIAPPISPRLDDLDSKMGDPEAGFARADIIVEMDGEIKSGQSAMPAEAPVYIAQWNDDMLTIYGSIAAPSNCQAYVAASPNVLYERVRIVAPCVEGSFGSRLSMDNVIPSVLTAIMAKAPGRPVMFSYTKEEHFAHHQACMCTKSHVRLGVNRERLTTAIEATQCTDAGICASTQENMLSAGTASLPFLCKTDNERCKGTVIVTNKVPSGSFKGYGYVEPPALINRVIMRACIGLGLDPVVYYEKDMLHHGERYYSALDQKEPWQCNASPDWKDTIRAAAEGFRWKNRFKGQGIPSRAGGNRRYGVDMELSEHLDIGGVASSTDVTMISVGGVMIQTVMTEFGNGIRDVYRKIMAGELCISADRVRVSISDTSTTPLDFGSITSRSTYFGGVSAQRAARDLRKNLFRLAEEQLGIPAPGWDFRGGMLRHLSNPEKVHDLHEILIYPDSLSGTGHWSGIDNTTIMHIQFAEMAMGTETGPIEITDHFGGSDAGTIMNPRAAYNRMTPFFTGLDMTIREETVWDKWDNKVLNPNLIEYKARTFSEASPCDHVCLESTKGRENDFLFGTMGIGEPIISPSRSVITMAVHNACGIELEEYPYLPAKILTALKEKEDRA